MCTDELHVALQGTTSASDVTLARREQDASAARLELLDSAVMSLRFVDVAPGSEPTLGYVCAVVTELQRAEERAWADLCLRVAALTGDWDVACA